MHGFVIAGPQSGVVLDNTAGLRYQLTRTVLEVPIQGEKGKSVQSRRGPATVMGEPVSMMPLPAQAGGKAADRRWGVNP